MSKRWKVFWLICAVLAATGIFMIVAGMVTGGFAALREREGSRIADFWEDDIMGIASDGSRFTDGGQTEDLPDITEDGGDAAENYIPGEENGDTVFSYDVLPNMKLDIGGAAVSIENYEGSRILVDTRYMRSDLRDILSVEEDNDELRIEMEHHKNLNDVGILYISIPRGTSFEKVSMDLGAGMIEADGIAAEELSAEAGAGQIVLNQFSAEKLEADCRAGQITLQGEVTDEADLDCAVGEILYTAAGGSDAYNYEISSSAGEVVIGSEIYGGLGHNMAIDNGSSCLIKTECRAGRIEILFEQ